MITERDLGIGVTIDVENVPLSKKYIVACLLAVAIWNGLEMLPIIYFTFKRFSGLYFWSIVAADVGVLIYATGFVLNNFQVTGNQTLPTILTCAAWIPMVSAQSLVLYSRLHLINLNDSIRRWVLIMIIVNGVTMHTATAVTTIGANGKSAELFYEPYGIMERMQVTVFFIQELILSSLYLWRAKSFLNIYRKRKARGGTAQRKLKSMMLHLVLSNVIVVVLDITILVLEFMGLYFVQVSYKAFVYSVKLKCEIGILNRLVDFVKSTTAKHHLPSHHLGAVAPDGSPTLPYQQGRMEDWTDFQLSSQMEREWETTLRNTFGVPMETEAPRMTDPEKGSMVEGGRRDITLGKTRPAAAATAAAESGGGDGAADDDKTSTRVGIVLRHGHRRRRSLSWPLGRGVATLTGDVYSGGRKNSSARTSTASSINSSTGRRHSTRRNNESMDRRRTSGPLAVDASSPYDYYDSDGDDDSGGNESGGRPPTAGSRVRRGDGGSNMSIRVAKPQVSHSRETLRES